MFKRGITTKAAVATPPQKARRPPIPVAANTAPIGVPVHTPRIAIVHDWLIGGGAELVVEQLHTLYPNAPIYTSYCSREWRKRLHGKVKTGYLQYWPFASLRKFLPVLRIWWFSHLNLSDYDLIITSSGTGEASGIRAPRSAIHIAYCHAPTPFCWSRYDEYMAEPGFGIFDGLARFGLKTLVGPLRRWDYKTAQQADYILTNSEHTKAEIQKYYDRNATVIHPPVATSRFKQLIGKKKRRGFVIAGRQTPYKRFDLAVAACSQLRVPLTVIGDGPEHKRLRKLAGKSVTFLGRVSDEVMAEELAAAKGFIFPGVDDFGITAVEAMAAGTPVIAYHEGGSLDYVKPEKTGLFFDEPTAKSLAGALRTFSRHPFKAEDISRSAEQFSVGRFQQKIRAFVKQAVTKQRTQ